MENYSSQETCELDIMSVSQRSNCLPEVNTVYSDGREIWTQSPSTPGLR